MQDESGMYVDPLVQVCITQGGIDGTDYLRWIIFLDEHSRSLNLLKTIQ